MCSGAIYWGNVGRVVYALSAERFYGIVGSEPDRMLLPCHEVFARSQRPVEIVGPALEDEALAVHAGFWTAG
jgi:tRNA(Arg) A34 adenosine deaminase TadA